jgi:hypothetical protein
MTTGKLLVDLDGIHNAFLFAECYKKDPQGKRSLSTRFPFMPTARKISFSYTPETMYPVPECLYRVLLDLDYDNRLGDLNNGLFVLRISDTYFPFRKLHVQHRVPPWKSADSVSHPSL